MTGAIITIVATLVILANAHICENSPQNSLHRTTWRNNIGANMTFFVNGEALSGYYSPGIVSNLQTIKHYPLVGFIIQQDRHVPNSTISAILAWVVSWESNDGITSWNGYISGRVIYTNSTLVLPFTNFTYTESDNYSQVIE